MNQINNFLHGMMRNAFAQLPFQKTQVNKIQKITSQFVVLFIFFFDCILNT